MIKNIVFDMGGVLIRFQTQKYADLYSSTPEEKKILLRELLYSVEWIRMDRGELTPQQVTDSVCTRVPAHMAQKVAALMSGWYRDIPPIEGMVELIRQLREKGYGIYLLSNVGKSFYDFRGSIEALRYFDGEFISCEHLLLKPEREIYQKFFEVFDLTPEECLFIDDNPANIEGAMRCGMGGIVFNEDVAELRRKLCLAGVKF